MSMVTSIVLICSIDDDVVEHEMKSILSPRTIGDMGLASGGEKHLELVCLGGGYDFLPKEKLYEITSWFEFRAWKKPSAAILYITHEDGDSEILRPI